MASRQRTMLNAGVTYRTPFIRIVLVGHAVLSTGREGTLSKELDAYHLMGIEKSSKRFRKAEYICGPSPAPPHDADAVHAALIAHAHSIG
ncbi:hypothetical protein A0H81_13940 [Grifola frondosa]|uniref:Uncharacterized protein n=1 Tax=Grifola frondosa TaxID=5627 RepID=A0A1C7LTC8_GRIFR|nr:hypothetical protein A0H81_13940 [Grifola frondosa]